MMHMGLQLLTVALEAAHIAPYQSLLGLVKDELIRHLFQVYQRTTDTSTSAHEIVAMTQIVHTNSLLRIRLTKGPLVSAQYVRMTPH